MLDDWDTLERHFEEAAHALSRLRADLTALGATPTIGVTTSTSSVVSSKEEPPLQLLLNTLDAFPTLVGYLQGRRSAAGFIVLGNEADVQDLLFVSLRPMLDDLVYEEPTKKGSVGYSIGDFSILSLKLILEVKYVKAKKDVKEKADEIAEDIWKYSSQTDCERIIFFVYDPNLLIPDRVQFAAAASATIHVEGRKVDLQTVIKP